MGVLLDFFATVLEIVLPFVFVFLVLQAQKYRQEGDIKVALFVGLAGLCLLFLLHGVPHPEVY